METIPHFSDKIPINWKKVEGNHKKIIEEENSAEMNANILSRIAK